VGARGFEPLASSASSKSAPAAVCSSRGDMLGTRVGPSSPESKESLRATSRPAVPSIFRQRGLSSDDIT
jgi:hypothetical protein